MLNCRALSVSVLRYLYMDKFNSASITLDFDLEFFYHIFEATVVEILRVPLRYFVEIELLPKLH